MRKTGFIGGKFLPLHQGHLYAIREAASQVEELYVILSSSERRDRELCERDGIKEMPAQARLSWLGQALKELPNTKLLHIEDDQGEDDYDWDEGAIAIKQAIGKPIDAVFSSETAYVEHFSRNYPDAAHIVIDNDRKTVPISATRLRRDLYRNWEMLPIGVKPYFTKRVAIVGTESCGKSTLAKKLAAEFGTTYVHEVGRDYCAKHSNQLTVPMFDRIAMEHYLLQERKADEGHKVIFVDSDAVITQYYLGMYFGTSSALIDEIAKKQQHDLVLYLEPDVPWVADGVRFAGAEDVRIRNNEMLKRMYRERGIELLVIGGSYEERHEKARSAVEGLFTKTSNLKRVSIFSLI